jgi:phosphoglucosamine mutase
MNAPAVQAAVKQVSEKLGSEGRILLRKSGTEPVLRVMSEAATIEAATEAVDTVMQAILDGGFAV